MLYTLQGELLGAQIFVHEDINSFQRKFGFVCDCSYRGYLNHSVDYKIMAKIVAERVATRADEPDRRFWHRSRVQQSPLTQYSSPSLLI